MSVSCLVSPRETVKPTKTAKNHQLDLIRLDHPQDIINYFQSLLEFSVHIL